MTAHAVSLIDSYIYGFVMQEVNLPFDDTSEMEEMVGDILPGLSTDVFPHLYELTVEHVLQPGYSSARQLLLRAGRAARAASAPVGAG